MRSVSENSEVVYVGLDVHKDSISAGVCWPGREPRVRAVLSRRSLDPAVR
jgi:hypothetical protein